MSIRIDGKGRIALLMASALLSGAWTRIPNPKPGRVSNQPPPTKPTPLGNSLEYYQANPVAFQALVDQASIWGGQKTLPISVGVVGGFNCKLTAPVQMTPAKNIKNFHHPKPTNDTSAPDIDAGPGFIVAKITSSTPNCPTIPLTINGGDYYWIVRRNPQKPYEPQSLIVGRDAFPVQTLSLKRCDSPPSDNPEDRVAIFPHKDACGGTAHAASRDAESISKYYAELISGKQFLRPNASKTYLVLGGPNELELWFTCDQGCCYADGFGG